MKNITFKIFFIAVALIFSFSILEAKSKKKSSNTKQLQLKIVNIPKKHNRYFKKFKKYANVFGVHVFATKDVSNKKVLHAANVLAQYLDNDQDGKVDDKKVLKKMLKHKAALFMYKSGKEPDMRKAHKKGYSLQNLESHETRPKGSSHKGFDATLEEVWHLLSSVGWSKAYAKVFAERKGSKIAKYMDKARGGYFKKIPKRYPKKAWFTYKDKSCDYNCMVAEYFYWSLSTILGSQNYKGRYQEIKKEWKLNTPKKFKKKDKRMYKLLTASKYKLPTKLPNGQYKVSDTSKTSSNSTNRFNQTTDEKNNTSLNSETGLKDNNLEYDPAEEDHREEGQNDDYYDQEHDRNVDREDD